MKLRQDIGEGGKMMKHDDFDDDDFFDDYEQDEEYLKAIDKNNCFIDDLDRARDEFCEVS